MVPMLRGDALILRWTRNGAAVGLAVAAAGLLLPAELGGYSPPTSAAALLHDVAAVVAAVVTGALAGAALGSVATRRRRRLDDRPR